MEPLLAAEPWESHQNKSQAPEARHIAGATNYPGGHTRKYILAGNIPVSHLRRSGGFLIITHGSAAKRGSTVGYPVVAPLALGARCNERSPLSAPVGSLMSVGADLRIVLRSGHLPIASRTLPFFRLGFETTLLLTFPGACPGPLRFL